MKTKSFFLLLAAAAALTLLAACKGSPTDPDQPGNITFRGSVNSGGSPLVGVQIFLSWDASKSTVTNVNGEFEFTGVSGNHFVITPSLRNHAFTPSNYELGAESRDGLLFTDQPATFGSKVGEIAADFTALNQNGQNFSLYSYFGKVVLIDFSADWCAPCQAEAAEAEAFYQAYKNQGLELITIMIDGPPATWASTYGLTFPVLDDDAEVLWAIYGENLIPLNIVLDRNMTIRYKKAGFYKSEITSAIKKLF